MSDIRKKPSQKLFQKRKTCPGQVREVNKEMEKEERLREGV